MGLGLQPVGGQEQCLNMRQLPEHGQEPPQQQLALEQQLRVLRHSAQQLGAQVLAAEPVAAVVAAAVHRKQELLPRLLLAVVLVQQGPAAGLQERTAGNKQAGNWQLLGQHTLP